MTRVLVVAGGYLNLVLPEADVYVGVDAGSLALLDAGLPLQFAVGDFDSVSTEEKERIRTGAEVLVEAQAEKNDTDLELALLTVFESYPDAQVQVVGALGGRLDHTLASVFLPSEQRLAPFMQQVTLVDEQNVLTYLPAGRHEVLARPAMDYLAFVPVQDQILTIEGAKYPLRQENYFFKKVYASNEFVEGQSVTVTVPSGYVLVIYSRDRRSR